MTKHTQITSALTIEPRNFNDTDLHAFIVNVADLCNSRTLSDNASDDLIDLLHKAEDQYYHRVSSSPAESLRKVISLASDAIASNCSHGPVVIADAQAVLAAIGATPRQNLDTEPLKQTEETAGGLVGQWRAARADWGDKVESGEVKEDSQEETALYKLVTDLADQISNAKPASDADAAAMLEWAIEDCQAGDAHHDCHEKAQNAVAAYLTGKSQ